MTAFKNSLLQKFVQRYHLDGLVENGLIEIEDGTISTCFMKEPYDYGYASEVRGLIELKNTGLPDGLLADLSPATLLKCLPILYENITIEYDNDFEGGFSSSLIVKDSRRTLIHRLCGIGTCSYDGKKLICEMEFKYILDKIIINDILKSIKATGTYTLAFFVENNKMMVGYDYEQCTELIVELADCFEGDFRNAMYLDVKHFKAIIKNNKHFDNACMQINDSGIIEFIFEEKDLISRYWLNCYQYKLSR